MILCTICARGGSKGLPGKNLMPLLGEPLIAWSVMQALQAGIFDAIAVSSDDEGILWAAQRAGAHFFIVRPPELASDNASKLPAITHAVHFVENLTRREFDIVVDLDVTSPLRTPEDIIATVKMLEESKCTNVITGTPAHRSPYFNMVEVHDGRAILSKPLLDIVRRQDCPPCFDMNASIYVWDARKFLADPHLFYPDTQLYIMPKERSWDIDDAMDFRIVEMLMRERALH